MSFCTPASLLYLNMFLKKVVICILPALKFCRENFWSTNLRILQDCCLLFAISWDDTLTLKSLGQGLIWIHWPSVAHLPLNNFFFIKPQHLLFSWYYPIGRVLPGLYEVYYYDCHSDILDSSPPLMNTSENAISYPVAVLFS